MQVSHLHQSTGDYSYKSLGRPTSVKKNYCTKKWNGEVGRDSPSSHLQRIGTHISNSSKIVLFLDVVTLMHEAKIQLLHKSLPIFSSWNIINVLCFWEGVIPSMQLYKSVSSYTSLF